MATDPLKERLRTRATLERHIGALGSLDPRLAPVIAASGEVPMRRGKGGLGKGCVGTEAQGAHDLPVRVNRRMPVVTTVEGRVQLCR